MIPDARDVCKEYHKMLTNTSESLDPEDTIARALDRLNPQDILKSPVLRRHFGTFLKRGTLEDGYDLLLLGYHGQLNPNSTLPQLQPQPQPQPQPRLEPRLQPRLQPQPQPPPQPQPQPQPQPRPELQPRLQQFSGHYLQSSLEETARQFFRHEYNITCNDELEKLVTAAKGFVRNTNPEVPDCQSLWSSNVGIFEDSEDGSGSTVFRLFRGRERIAKTKTLNVYLNRLTLVYIHHEISEIAAAISQPLSRGQSRVSAACTNMAAELSVPRKTIRSQMKHGTCFLELFLLCGPGDLFALYHAETYFWERSLPVGYIEKLVEFRKKFYPELEAKVRKLDLPASYIMIAGLVACGWSQQRLAGCTSSVAKKLGYFVDLVTSRPKAPSENNSYDHPSSMADDEREPLSVLASVALRTPTRKRQCSTQLMCPKRLCRKGHANRDSSEIDIGNDDQLDDTTSPCSSTFSTSFRTCSNTSEDTKQVMTASHRVSPKVTLCTQDLRDLENNSPNLQPLQSQERHGAGHSTKIHCNNNFKGRITPDRTTIKIPDIDL